MTAHTRNALAALALAALAWLPAHADTWKPTRPVEFVVGAGPGGALEER